MKILILLSLLMMIVGCEDSEMGDLQTYVSDTTAKPKGRIKPLPEFTPYSAFAYSASAQRSPFESPVLFEEGASRSMNLVSPPDENRNPDPLERYSLGDLNLVGTLEKTEEAGLKALVKTHSGSVHMIKEGHYMGKNNGRVISITESKLDLVEVVPNGSGGWISRPQSMGLKASSGVDK